MGQRFLEEGDVPEGNSYRLLQLIQAAARYFDGSGYEPDFSWMYSQAWPTVVIFSASSSGISSPVFSSKA